MSPLFDSRVAWSVLLLLLTLTGGGFTCDDHNVEDKIGPRSASSSNDESQRKQEHATRSDNPDDIDIGLTDDVWTGICLAHSWQNGGREGYGTDASTDTLDHLETLGVSWVSLTPFGWMPSKQASSVRGEHTGSAPDAAESRTRLEKVVAQSRERGMRVVLKPHIWIRGGAYRGEISPKDEQGKSAWTKWWESYDAFVLHYADIAEELDIPVFYVGVELESAIQARPERFLETVVRVRDAYDGELVYSANWDETQSDRIWKALDYVGVQFYPPLSKDAEPTVEELTAAVEERLAPWVELSERIDRPLVVSEVGYRASPDAAETPYAWPQHSDEDGRSVDQEIQRRAYVALFRALGDVQSLKGVFLWKYFTDRDTDERHPWGFSPRGYEAEAVIERAYAPADSDE